MWPGLVVLVVLFVGSFMILLFCVSSVFAIFGVTLVAAESRYLKPLKRS